MAEAPDGLTHLHSGKVRELFRADDGRLVMLATDRISAFDHVLASEIPDKGRVLTAMSVWWFDQLGGIVANHLLSTDDQLLPSDWRGRVVTSSCPIVCAPGASSACWGSATTRWDTRPTGAKQSAPRLRSTSRSATSRTSSNSQRLYAASANTTS